MSHVKAGKLKGKDRQNFNVQFCGLCLLLILLCVKIMFEIKEILSVTLILFSVIDILGSIPIVINLRKKVGHIQSGKATIAAGILMVLFLLLGESILSLFGIGVDDFAIAGALIIFALGAEMILGIEIFKPDTEASATSTSIVRSEEHTSELQSRP